MASAAVSHQVQITARERERKRHGFVVEHVCLILVVCVRVCERESQSGPRSTKARQARKAWRGEGEEGLGG